MKVILKADVKGTGKKGEVVEVSDGFAKNFLLKRSLAELATASGINEAEQRRTADAYHRAENIKALKEQAAKLNGSEVKVPIRTGKNGKVFGSVTSDKIAAALSELGFDVDKKRVTTKETLKMVGTYDAEVRFMEGVIARIKVHVVPLE